MSRQWQGRRNEEENEEEDESSFSSSADRGTNRSSGDFKKGSIGPPPSYDGSREVGIFEEYRVRAKCCSQPT